ncbi:MAG: HAD family hydrolase [Gammaproteobacteria bacterium]
MIKAILFDLDDTLWDAAPALMRAEEAQYAWIERHAPRVAARYANAELRELRRDLATRRPEIAHDFTRLRIEALAERLEECGYPAALAADCIAHFVAVRSAVTLYDDVLPALARLAREYVLVALTNGNADLSVCGLEGHFRACVSPAEVGVRKPHPRMFAAALAHADAAPTEAVHVGDQPLYDVEGARRAGLRTVWINRDGGDWPSEYDPAHAVIASLGELEQALAQLP